MLSRAKYKYILKLKQMSDVISLQRISKLHPKIRNEVSPILKEIEDKGVNIRITQGLRTIEEQNNIYAQGRTIPGKIVTDAKGGSSFHNYGLAIDFCLLHKDGTISFNMKENLDSDKIADWMEVVNTFKSHGWEWGGDWIHTKDTPHFQKVFGLTPQICLKMIQDKKVDKEGYILI